MQIPTGTNEGSSEKISKNQEPLDSTTWAQNMQIPTGTNRRFS